LVQGVQINDADIFCPWRSGWDIETLSGCECDKELKSNVSKDTGVIQDDMVSDEAFTYPVCGEWNCEGNSPPDVLNVSGIPWDEVPRGVRRRQQRRLQRARVREMSLRLAAEHVNTDDEPVYVPVNKPPAKKMSLKSQLHFDRNRTERRRESRRRKRQEASRARLLAEATQEIDCESTVAAGSAHSAPVVATPLILEGMEHLFNLKGGMHFRSSKRAVRVVTENCLISNNDTDGELQSIGEIVITRQCRCLCCGGLTDPEMTDICMWWITGPATPGRRCGHLMCPACLEARGGNFCGCLWNHNNYVAPPGTRCHVSSPQNG
jgi:hypothetical protein